MVHICALFPLLLPNKMNCFSDVDTAGIVVTIACGITAALSMISALLLFLKHTRFFLAQSIGLALCALWIFAGLVAFDFYFHTRSARVTATIGGVAVPQAVISAVEKQLGVTGVYKRIEYRECPLCTYKGDFVVEPFDSEAGGHNPVVHSPFHHHRIYHFRCLCRKDGHPIPREISCSGQLYR